MKEAKLIVLDPGHFHASLVQSEMYPGLSKQVSVYAPLGPDVLDYLNRVALFNARKRIRLRGKSKRIQGRISSSGCCGRSRATL